MSKIYTEFLQGLSSLVYFYSLKVEKIVLNYVFKEPYQIFLIET